MELLKTQMQICGRTGICDALQAVVGQAGLAGLYRGLGVTMMREVPAEGVYFGSYEAMLRSFELHKNLNRCMIFSRFGDSTTVIVTAGGILLNQNYTQIHLEQIRNTEDLCIAFRKAGDMRDQHFSSEELDQRS